MTRPSLTFGARILSYGHSEKKRSFPPSCKAFPPAKTKSTQESAVGKLPYLGTEASPEIMHTITANFPFPSPDFVTRECTGLGELNWSWHWTGY